MHRRNFLQAGSAALFAATFGGVLPAFAAAPAKLSVRDAALQDALRGLDADSGGRVGIAALDSADGRTVSVRGDERFRMCSTFKFLLAAAVLRQAERGTLSMDQALPIRAEEVSAVEHAPFTQTRVGGSATIAELCESTMTLSDNPAANILLPLVGGPPGLTAFLRSTGDNVTRLDRKEPELNYGAPDDPRDTSSPLGQVATMRRLLLGEALQAPGRQQLTDWLIANKTGDARLRAGLPASVKVGDKTGTAGPACNDIAIVWPPGRAPWLIACYVETAHLDGDGRNALQASVARAVYRHWA